jgi:hypothetical protein
MKVLVCFELLSLVHRVRYFYIRVLKQYHDFLAFSGVPVVYMGQRSS